MNERRARRLGTLLSVAALLLVVWLGAGFAQWPHNGWGGYMYGPEYIVDGVEPGGAAEEAGIRAGDRVISVDGRPVEELPMQSRWARTRIGESHRIVVEREGETLSMDVLYGPPLRSTGRMRLGAAAVGLSFIGFGLWALFTVRNSHALTLAFIGLTAGVTMSPGPDLGAWNGVATHIQMACALLWVLLLLRFSLTFPKPKRAGKGRLATGLLYGAWVLALALMILELIVHPRLYHAAGNVVSLLMFVFGVLILAALAHTLVKTPREELRESGMNLVFIGLVVAIAGLLVAILGPALGVNLPGLGYTALLFAAIPLTMVLAVKKQARVDRAPAS